MYVNNSNFKFPVQQLNPLSIDYRLYWKEERRRCIEGYWSCGKFMPGPIYQFINHWKIELNKGKNSKNKVIDHPLLRDLEWEKGYLFMEARGFSGFEYDKYTTCNRELKDELMFYDEYENRKLIAPTESDIELINNNSKRFTLIHYAEAREYLKWNHKADLGRPLMENNAKNVVDIEARGGGKDLEENTLVYTKNGQVKIKDINIGDFIYGANGKLTKVIDKRNFIDQLQYKVTFADGRSIECGKGHLWTLIKNSGKLITTELNSIKDNYLGYQRSNGKRDPKYFVKYCKPIDYEFKEVPLQPYYLGLWLGDGNNHNAGVTSNDKEIVDYLYSYSNQHGLHININTSSNKSCPTYNICSDKGKHNHILNKLDSLNLRHNKHIPDIYLYSSIEQRIELLKGLMDSDGFSDNRHVEYTTTDKKLAEGFYSLVNSLGIKCTRTTKQYKDYKLVYRFALKPKFSIFKLDRKKRYWNSNNTYKDLKISKTGIVNIEKTSIKPSVCIAVDNLDKLYVAGDYIVTHNSFFASNLIAWNFLHDGVFSYEDLKTQAKSETLVGAIDTKYSSGLLKKVKLGLENLSGGIELGEIYYPPPFLKKYSGSWESGKTIVAEYDQKVGNNWVKKGSKSMIYHRSFADNPMAANGTRPGFSALEEIGFMDNLLLALGQLKECTANGSEKFGTIWMFGTGGDMAGGSTEAVKDVFYNPEGYDCLVFNDEYENKGKIGYFVPADKTLNQFKDEEGITNSKIAGEFLEKERKKLANGRSKQALYDELQNRPRVPSEAFLVQQGNVFPVAELKEHLSNLESSSRLKEAAATGWMQRDKEGKAFFKVDHDLIPCDYPTKYSKDPKGAVEIWEQPIENPPYSLYIAGIDSIDQDQADSSSSMGSIIIYKRFKDSDSTYHLPVAEYTGRPDFATDFYEQCRRLLEYYNAKALYENQTPGIKAYFETKNCLHLLSRQPSIIKSISPSSKVERTFGTHMTSQIKDAIEIMTRDWLKTELSPGILQLTNILSIPLLKELIGYNKDGNFDRVIAFMLVMMQDLELHNVQVEEAIKENEIDDFFNRPLFVNTRQRLVNY